MNVGKYQILEEAFLAVISLYYCQPNLFASETFALSLAGHSFLGGLRFLKELLQ